MRVQCVCVRVIVCVVYVCVCEVHVQMPRATLLCSATKPEGFANL